MIAPLQSAGAPDQVGCAGRPPPQALQPQALATLASGASTAVAGVLVGRGVQLAGQVVLARALGPALFGVYSLGWTVLRITGLMAPLGLDSGVVYFASRHRDDPGRFKGVVLASLALAIGGGALIGCVVWVAAPWLAVRVFGEPRLTGVLRGLSLAMGLLAGLRVAASATRVSQRVQYSIYAEAIGQPAVNLLLFLILFVMGERLIGAVAACTASHGVAFLLALYYLFRLFPEALSSETRPLFNTLTLIGFSLPIASAGTMLSLNAWVGRLLVGYFQPAAEVGIYQAASEASILFAIIVVGFSTILAPTIADLHRREQWQMLDELFKVSTKWTLYLSIPPFLVIAFLPREVMTVLYGMRYESGAVPLLILSIGQLVNAGTGAVGLMLVMTGHQTELLRISALALAVNVALSCILIPHFGLAGAAVASTCAIGGVNCMAVLVAWRSIRVWPYDARYWKGLIAGALAAAPILFFPSASIRAPVLRLSVTSLIVLLMFGAALLQLGLDTEDRQLAATTRRRLSGGR
ncbi:MAG: flippase [Candidatus Binataceae bacterium]